jgi:hypothetical protein
MPMDLPILRSALIKVQHVACEHKSARATVSVRQDGKVELFCEECYQLLKPRLEMVRLHANPLQSELCCAMCDERPSRLNKDLCMGICDTCLHQSRDAENEATKNHILERGVYPDIVDDGVLYIGGKECAVNIETLRSLNIKRILVCCSHLPELISDDSILYHRLPMADSLDENLCDYLPSAFSFIAEGVEAGHCTLVHCNAGVSRSGSIAVSWLMKTRNISFDTAYELIRRNRPIVTPNSNFINQIRENTDYLNDSTAL